MLRFALSPEDVLATRFALSPLWETVMSYRSARCPSAQQLRGSWLDDANGQVTGIEQQRFAVSTGVGYRLNRHWEVSGEYRHDFSDEAPDANILSFHLAAGY